MSLLANFELMADYNQHMNKRIYAVASQLSLAELSADRGAFFCSIIGTLNHILVGDIIWLQRFSTMSLHLKSLEYVCSIEKPKSLDAILLNDFAQLSDCRLKVDGHIQTFVSELTDVLIAAPLTYHDVKGDLYTKNFGLLIQHLFNHQTHHRGQVSTLFSQLDIDIGVTDLLANIPEM